MTQKPVTDILLNGELYNSGDDYDRIYSVIEFVNTLTGTTSWTAGGYYSIEELPDAVLHSYFVDYLDAQLQQGGLSRFIIASHWNRGTNAYIRHGLGQWGLTGTLPCSWNLKSRSTRWRTNWKSCSSMTIRAATLSGQPLTSCPTSMKNCAIQKT